MGFAGLCYAGNDSSEAVSVGWLEFLADGPAVRPCHAVGQSRCDGSVGRAVLLMDKVITRKELEALEKKLPLSDGSLLCSQSESERAIEALMLAANRTSAHSS